MSYQEPTDRPDEVETVFDPATALEGMAQQVLHKQAHLQNTSLQQKVGLMLYEFAALRADLDAHHVDLVAAYRETDKWKDRYNREVLGLNNEGDAIGGEPARGLAYYSEYWKGRALEAEQRIEQLASALRAFLQPPPEPDDGTRAQGAVE